MALGVCMFVSIQILRLFSLVLKGVPVD
jgi:hypothetical protein